MSKKISLISLFSTIFFLILTVVLGLIIHYLGDPNEPIFALFGTLFIGMFLCLLTCLSNLNTLIKLYDDQQRTNKDVYISTCPDYWTKRHVINELTKQRATMCHNISPTNELVYGSLDGEQLQFTTSNLTELRDTAEYPPTIEPFIQTINTRIKPGETDYEKYHHVHNDVVVNANGSLHTNDGSGSVYASGTLNHPHTFSGIAHSFEHSHIPGESDDILSGINNRYYSGSLSNFNNWINPYSTNGLNTIEINLNKLNDATNTCDLTRHFAWTEAETKCPKKPNLK